MSVQTTLLRQKALVIRCRGNSYDMIGASVVHHPLLAELDQRFSENHIVDVAFLFPRLVGMVGLALASMPMK